jgi:hypothetical protein
MIGKIKRVPLREVWKHEAHNFTKWLEENIDVLNEILDFNLSNIEREKRTGDFNVDLVAEDEKGSLVIIENQLEKSDHDHLGKLITYLSATDARKAIWIVAQPRPEHIQAITWLNESATADFYLIKIEGIQIEHSPPAPLLTLIVGPSEEGKEVGKQKQERAERYDVTKKFWTQLLEKSKQKTKLHASISPQEYNWIWASTGKQGLNYDYIIRQHEAEVALAIDRGKEMGEENRKIFEELEKSKKSIETKFGEPLEWDYVPNRRVCLIRKKISLGGLRDVERWSKVQDAMIDSMIRLDAALKPYIEKLES